MNVSTNEMPTVRNTPMIAMAIIAAISPYSIAVAPFSSATSFLINDNKVFPFIIATLPVSSESRSQ